MRIGSLFFVALFLMLVGMFWVSIRQKQPIPRRSRFVDAIVCLMAIAELTRDIVFDFDHMRPLVWALILLGAVVGPVLRGPEDQIDPHAKDLRK